MNHPSNLLLAATALGAVATGKVKGEERKRVTPQSLNAARDLLAETGLELQAREIAKHETRTVTEEFEPKLIEGHLEGCVIDVPMPNGETWRFAKPDTCAAPCPVLVCIHAEKTAFIFRPSAEGAHPFLGMARRFGVDAPRSHVGLRAARGRLEDLGPVLDAVPDVPPVPGDEIEKGGAE